MAVKGKDKKEPTEEKKVPLGKPLDLTDEDLDRLSIVTPMDIENAKAAWRRNVPSKYKNILDAEEVKPEEEVPPDADQQQ